MGTGSWFKVSSYRLDMLGIEPSQSGSDAITFCLHISTEYEIHHAYKRKLLSF